MPKIIKLDPSKTYTAEEIAEINAANEKALTEATVEGANTSKNQLQGEISTLKAEKEEQAKKAAALAAEKAAAAEELEKIRKEKEEHEKKLQEIEGQRRKKEIGEDVANALAQTEKETKEKLEALENAVLDQSKELDKLREENRKEKLNNYRLKLIADNADQIIPELVSGSTPEELEASVKMAKERFAAIEERVRKTANVNTAQKERTDYGAPPLADDDEEEVPRLGTSHADRARYAKERESMLQKVYDQYRKK